MSSCCNCDSGGNADFELIHSCTVKGNIPVTKYISKSTGLTVVHADIEGPIVSGYICVATRVVDDDGLPHTIEHLIFFGSQQYPCAGVLDRFANKCLASGTNAWTDVDHTCYTVSTAGSDGFCQLLPICMDHILYPLLTDAAFTTEVHHVGGRGYDGGVIYSEVLALENTNYSRATDTLFKELYPSYSGYRWNVGGALENLREFCNNARVKAFHKRFYHPRNICVIICGKVDMNRIFRSLYPVITKKGANNNQISTGIDVDTKIVKPWLTEELQVISDIPFPVEKTIQFPSYYEEGGCLVTVGFLGPSVVTTDLKEIYAIILLLKYLTKSACAPLQQDIVEKDTGYLATLLDFNAFEFRRTAFIFVLDSVAVEDKDKIVVQLRKSLRQQLNNFDKARMDDMIMSGIQAELTLLENTPHETISELVIKDFLYGDNDHSLFKKRLNRINEFESLLQEPAVYWTGLIENAMLAPNWVAVYAEPSRSLMKELVRQEDARISKRKRQLGEVGLLNFMLALDTAILENNQRIPKKILRKVKTPSMKSLQYYRVNRIKNPTWVSTADFPATLCLDDISTSFIYVALLVDTSNMEDKLRPFLPLFKEVLLSSPILTSDSTGSHELIPYEEVCASRDRALQVCELDFGLERDVTEGGSRFSCGSYSHILALDLQMEMDKTEEGMLWIKKTLWRTHWTLERIKVAVNKMVGDVYNLRRDSSRMCQTILRHLLYKDNSNVLSNSVISQLRVLQDLGADDDDKLAQNENLIRAAFDSILKVFTDPSHISLHIAADVETLKKKLEKRPCKSLGNLLKMCFPFQEATTGTGKRGSEFANSPDTEWMVSSSKILRDARNSVQLNQIIFSMGTEDVSYMAMVAPGPSSFLDPDLPALLITLQYFSQTEGPLYHRIRGEGFAYSFNVVTKVTEGLIYFNLYRCTDLVGAYSACLTVIAEHLASSSKLWSKDFLISAKNSLIFECLETQKTPLSLAGNSCLNYYRNVPGNFMRDLVVKISKVRMKKVRKMAKKYLDSLFQSATDNYATVVVCPEEKADFTQSELLKLGKQMRVVQSFDDL